MSESRGATSPGLTGTERQDEPARERLRVAAIAACLLVLTGLILFLARPGLVPAHAGLGTAKIQPIELVGLAWVVFGAAVWLARKAAVKLVVWLILAGGIALQVAALAGPPQNSSDLYRYIWDGRVQVAGIDPYLYAPGDAGVARLRDDLLWSPDSGNHSGYPDCVPDAKNTADPGDSLVSGCTKLNRPKVPTVYPPVAEAYFTAIQLAAPADDSTTPVQAAAAGFAVLTTVLLLFGLRRQGKDPRLAALWAWCPTVALEAGQNGHVDVVGVALTAAALLLLATGGRSGPDGRSVGAGWPGKNGRGSTAQARKRKIVGGVLLGLAIATKITPVLAVPGVLRRGWREICAAAASAVAIVYVPHVIAVGSKIIGFFPGYLNQEGYSTGTGFSIIGLFVTGKAATVVAVVILGLIAVAIIRFGDSSQPWRGGVLMTSAALAVCTPHFQWYAILLVMLVALDGRPEWLAIAAGGYLSNSPNLYIHGIVLHDPRLVGYGGGAAVAGALALLRLVLARRPHATVPAEAVVTVAAEATAPAEEPVLAGDPVLAEDPALAEQVVPAEESVPAATAETVPAEKTNEPAAGATAESVVTPAEPADEPEHEPAEERAEEPVIEPTAVLRPSVTIGADGKPSFARGDDSPGGDSYRVLTWR